MPWSNQGGGGSGGGSDGGGGGWQGGGGQGPWGSGRGGGGPQAPNLEELLKKSQDRFRGLMPGGRWGSLGLLLLVVAAIVIWGLSGFYRVGADENGVVLRFGKYLETTSPGLHYHVPTPIESVIIPNVTRVNQTDVGFRGADDSTRIRQLDVIEESLMLTGDENIVDIDFTVQWRISDARKYLFNLQLPIGTVKAVAESAMREIVGRMDIDNVISEQRALVEQSTQELMQTILDDYGAGILVTEVKLAKSDPPAQVIDAFRDVQAAKQDQERKRNEAEAYRNDIIPRAKGEAAQIVFQAEGYKRQTVAEAEGEVSRYLAILTEYTRAKDVTRQRMYLETLEEVFGGMNKVVIDSASGSSGVVPYLPLPEIRNRAQSAEGAKK